jgi:hypothetical protein
MLTSILAALFILSCTHAVFTDVNSMAGASAARSLFTGEAKAYHEEYVSRLAILKDPGIKNAELPGFTVAPHVLFHALDITADPNVWPNTSMARFYNKDTVVLIHP